MNILPKSSPNRGAICLRCLSLFLLAILILPQTLGAADDEFGDQAALTQADLDAYADLLPLLTPELGLDAARANQLMIEAGVSKKRLIYVGAKVAIAQAMAIGAISPQQLADHQVPQYLHPTAEEIALVNTNLHSLTVAQEKARRAAAGNAAAQ